MNIDKYMEKRYGPEWRQARCRDCQWEQQGECKLHNPRFSLLSLACGNFIPKSRAVYVCTINTDCPFKDNQDCSHCDFGKEVKNV